MRLCAFRLMPEYPRRAHTRRGAHSDASAWPEFIGHAHTTLTHNVCIAPKEAGVCNQFTGYSQVVNRLLTGCSPLRLAEHLALAGGFVLQGNGAFELVLGVVVTV